MINSCLLFAQNFFFPKACPFCHTQIDNNVAACLNCYHQLPWQKYGCPICARSLTSNYICGECINRTPSFDKTLAVFQYQPPIAGAIHSLKFHSQFIYARFFGSIIGEMLAQRNQHQLPDAILAVPNHPYRLRTRGFNQAHEIARTIARRLNLPLIAKPLIRTVNNTPQRLLSKPQRLDNMQNSMQLVESALPNRVAVVDDVMTTGATLDAVAQTLKSGTTTYVENWVIARA